MPLCLCSRTPMSIPSSRLQQRLEILVLIGSGLSESENSRTRGCSRSLVRKIRSAFRSRDNIFEQTAQLGRPTKLTDELLMTLARKLSVLIEPPSARHQVLADIIHVNLTRTMLQFGSLAISAASSRGNDAKSQFMVGVDWDASGENRDPWAYVNKSANAGHHPAMLFILWVYERARIPMGSRRTSIRGRPSTPLSATNSTPLSRRQRTHPDRPISGSQGAPRDMRR
jgi:hypothetical protein